MNTLWGRGATLWHMRIPRVRIPPSYTPTQTRACWQQNAGYPASRLRPSADSSLCGYSPPLPRPRLPQRQAPHHSRAFQQPAQRATSAPKENSPGPPKMALTNAEQRRRDWAIVRRLAVHIWPKDDWTTRGRVVFGVSLLIGGKVRHRG
jgi:hypothetical protein